MLKRLLTLVIISGLFLAGTGTGSGNYDTNAKIKAVYIYNFTKYVEWPKDYRMESFVIGVLEDDALLKELQTTTTGKTVFGQNIQVQKFSSTSDISKCHILYVSDKTNESLSTVEGKIKGFSTLLVTNKPGLAKEGSAINFVIMQNRQKFELNESNAVKYNLKVSNSLEALAILVN